MRKIDQKQRNNNNNNNGIIPTSIRSFSSYLRIVSSGASTVASTVRSAASAASSTLIDSDSAPDQVLWAGFDKLECEDGTSHRVLLLGYQHGFQVWDVEHANNVRNIVSRFDGPVSFMQILPKPNDHPLLVLCGGPTVSTDGNIKNNNDNINSGYMPTVVWFYSFKSRSYIKELKFRSVVYSVRCSSRIVAVLQAAQIHCFDVATLEQVYTILTNPVAKSSSRFESIGLGPLAMGPRWIAYSGSMVALPNTCVSPQHLTGPKGFTASGSNGSVVAHYAKQSSKQLAVGIVTLGDIGYKKLSSYYLPDGSISQQVNDLARLPDTENVGMVIVRDVVSKSVIAQFKAHDSPIASLCFDPSGVLLVTASVHGHSFNVFRIGPGPGNDASFTHLYKLQRGFTNAVIQDISFSVDSRWITISSSRGTSHLFAISPTGGPVNMRSGEECAYNAAGKPPVTLSAVGRVRSGNSGWRNMVNGSSVIASTFHKCKGNNDPNSDSGPALSKYYMLIFSSSGSVIQYALRVSSEADSVYESPLDNNLKLTVDPIQKWNICSKQNRREREREENIDIYGENAHIDNRKVCPERTENASNIKKEIINAEDKNHCYISEAELQMHALQTPLWAKPQICFETLTIDDTINVDEVKSPKGESEIENVPTRTVEVKSAYLVPAVDYLQGPTIQTARVPALDDNNDNNNNCNVLDEHEKVVTHEPSMETEGGLGKGDEETGEDDGVVNSDSRPVSHTLPETVDNIEHSESGTRSELVNTDVGQKLEDRFEDQGAEFD